MTNELIATPTSDTSWYTGIAQVEELIALSDAIDGGNWLEAGVGVAPLGQDVAMVVADPTAPLSILMQVGLSWVMEHVPRSSGRSTTWPATRRSSSRTGRPGRTSPTA
jgi:hypothetical protein